MNEAGGHVVRVDVGKAWVRLESSAEGCGSCRQRSGCGLAPALGAAAAGGDLLCLPNSIHAQVGDRVLVCAAEGEVLRAAWRAYGIPLTAGMLAAGAAMAVTGSDVWAGLGMLVGLVLGVLLMRRQRLDSDDEGPMLTLRFNDSGRDGTQGG